MSHPTYREMTFNALWKQNSALVQVLGLCPVLVMSNSLVNGLSLGLATALVMAITGSCISAIRQYAPNELRIPIFVLIIAAVVTVVDMAMNAYLHELYLVLGLFIPLITTNCIVLARAEAFASKNPVKHSAYDGLMMGIGLALVLTVLGAMRELIGSGTLFAGIDQIVGKELGQHLVLHLAGYKGFILAILPPGAFVGLGLLIAAFNVLEKKRAAKEALRAQASSVENTPDSLAEPA